MNMDDRPLVSVICATYNHEAHIAQAINSFLAQKTTFPFEIVIGEDYSTDKTRDICLKYQSKYPNRVKLILQPKNVGAMSNHVSAMQAAQGKYLANCEGDDYWTDQSKLQKQVDYMESHPECSLCFHAFELVNGQARAGRIIRAAAGDKVFDNENMFGYDSSAASPTLLFKKEHIVDLPKWVSDAPVGDIPLKLLLSQKGTVAYLDQVMAARRIGVAGSWSSRMRLHSSRRPLFPSMIRMLDGFDEYSNHRYHTEVIEKQFQYEMKSWPQMITFRSFRDLIRREKYRDYFKKIAH